jgi:hypothetical protein
MSNWSRGMRAATASALCTLGAAFPVIADSKESDCDLHTLHGLYLFSAAGYTMPAGVPLPKAIIELLEFNGDGTIGSPGATRSVNGVVIRSPAGGTGTYVLNTDCTGTLLFTNGPGFDIFVAPKGKDLWMIQTDPNNVFQGKVTKLR